MCNKIGDPQGGTNEVLLLRAANEVLMKCQHEELTSKANKSPKKTV